VFNILARILKGLNDPNVRTLYELQYVSYGLNS
jgi:hypothetical protein